VKNLIKKIKDKGKKDIANFSKEKLKKFKEKENAKLKKELKEVEIKKKKDIEIIKKELVKYKDNEKELLELHKIINKRFNVSKTETNAKIYGVASIYFNALKVFGMPEDYYPVDPNAPALFMPPHFFDDPGYWLMMFQLKTQDNDNGHAIPEMPGQPNKYVIHGFLFPMTSTSIYLGKFEREDSFGIIYQPNDSLFNREFLSKYTENYFKTYTEAYTAFEKIIEKHLDGDEENFYSKKKKFL